MVRQALQHGRLGVFIYKNPLLTKQTCGCSVDARPFVYTLNVYTKGRASQLSTPLVSSFPNVNIELVTRTRFTVSFICFPFLGGFFT